LHRTENNDFSIKQETFESLFSSDNYKKVEKFTCNHCKFEIHKIDQTIKFDFQNNKYLIINLSLCNLNGEKIKSKIVDFKTNKVVIPLDKNKKNSFKVVSAIKFLPSNNNDYTEGGHYICWKKFENKWLVLDDTKMYIHEKFIRNLDGVTILVLEKNTR
jgi:hypothetical protein